MGEAEIAFCRSQRCRPKAFEVTTLGTVLPSCGGSISSPEDLPLRLGCRPKRDTIPAHEVSADETGESVTRR